jgi:hypothetical protein
MMVGLDKNPSLMQMPRTLFAAPSAFAPKLWLPKPE